MAKRRKAGRPAREPKKWQTPVVFSYSEEKIKEAQNAYYTCLDRLMHGTDDDEIFHTVANGVQMAYYLREHIDADPEHMEQIKATVDLGLAAAREVDKRHDRLNRWGATGDEYLAIRECLALADRFIEICARREVRDAGRRIHGLNEHGVQVEDAHKLVKGWKNEGLKTGD